MARTPEDHSGGQTGTSSTGHMIHMSIDGHEIVNLPSADFVKNADILRDGQDLVLQGPDGTSVVIEGYFNADPAPLLQAPDGQALSPQLVNSFVHHAGPVELAQNGTLDDESPVGAIKEVSGEATVTHPNGTVETATVGTPIFEGDIVETHDQGAVNIVFIDETSLSVSSDAKLAIDEYVFDPSSQSGTTDVSVLRGLFVFTSGLIGRDDPDDVKIDTPMGSIGIRGTVIVGNADTGDVTVMEGAIVLRGFNGDEVTLAQQFETAKFVPSSGDVSYVGKADPATFAQDYSSLKSVSPDLFSGIADDGHATDSGNATDSAAPKGDDAGASHADGGDQGSTDSPTGQDSAATTDGPAMAPATTGGTTDATATDTSPTDGNTANADSANMTTDTSFDGGAETSFDGSTAESPTQTEPLTSSAATSTTGTTTTGTTTGGTTTSGATGGTGSGTTGSDTATDTSQLAPPPPPAPASSPSITTGTLIINENSGTGAPVGAVATTDLSSPTFTETGNGTGAGLFNIDSAGNITVQTGASFDFETTTSYSYEVQATDGTNTITKTLTINVGNLDDTAPTLDTNAGTSVNEGGTTTLTAAMLSAGDVDTSNTGIEFTLDSAPANGVTLKLGGSVLSASQTFSMQDVIDGLVTIEHDGTEPSGAGDFQFSLSDGTNGGPGAQIFSITINPANDAPAASDDLSWSTDEDTAMATQNVLGNDSDPDAGDTLSVSAVNGIAGNVNTAVAGDNGGLFTIQSDGTVNFDSNGEFESLGAGDSQTTSVTYTISDGNGGTDTATAEVTVTGVNDAPTFTDQGHLNVDENSSTGAAVGSVASYFSDIEGDTLTFSAGTGSGTGDALFDIDGSGNVTVASGADLNFETTASYTFDVQVDDGNGGTTTNQITIDINNIAETTAGLGDAGLTASAGDDYFTITGGGSGTSSIDGLGGADTYDASGVGAALTFTVTASNSVAVTDGTGTHNATNVEHFIGDGTNSNIFHAEVINGDTFEGGAATDDTYTIDTSGLNGTIFTLTGAGTATVANGGATDTLSGVETLYGSDNGGDTFTVTNINANQHVTGGTTGADILSFSGLANYVSFNFSTNQAAINGGGTITFNDIEQSIGSDGNDTFIVYDGDGNLSLDGGIGVDTYDGSAAIVTSSVFDVSAGTVNIGGGDIDTVTNIESFIGGTADDTFIAKADGLDYSFDGNSNTGAGDTADFSNASGAITADLGNAGVQTIGGGFGDYTLSGIENVTGGDFNDTFLGSSGNNAIEGGAGTDTADYMNASSGINIDMYNGGAGYGQGVDGDGGTDKLTNIEVVKGSSWNDTIIGTAATSELWGRGGDDTLEIRTASTIADGGASSAGDTLQFAVGGAFNLDDAHVVNIETIDATAGGGSGTQQEIHIDVTSALLSNDNGGNLVINLDNTDTLDLNFTSGDFHLTGGDLDTASATFTYATFTDGAGRTITVNYAVGGAGRITDSLPHGLDLNNIGGTDGFKIADSNGEGFGYGVAAVGDINGDGYSDLVFTKATNASDDGRAFFLYGNAALADTTAGNLAVQSGLLSTGGGSLATNVNVGGFGDFNGDGIQDYIVSSITADSFSTAGTGNAQVIDGSNGSMLAQIDGMSLDFSGGDIPASVGQSISFIGDVNGDGFSDVIIGAPGTDANGTDADAGAVYMLTGNDDGPATIDIGRLGMPHFESGPALSAADNTDVESLFAAGGTHYAVILGADNTIRFENMADPQAPVYAGTYDITNATVTALTGYSGTGDMYPMANGVADIMVKGPYLFILGNTTDGGATGQITVLNVGDPSAPAYVDSFSSTDLKHATALDMTKDGRLVAVSDDGGSTDGSLVWLDVSENGTISGAHGASIVANTNLAGANDVAVAGNYAYVSASGGVYVVDIRTGPNPNIVGSAHGTANAAAVYTDTENGMLYEISANGDLVAFDLNTDASGLTSSKQMNDPALVNATDIVVDHGIAYVTTPSGVIMADVYDPNMHTINNIDNTITNDDNALAVAFGDDGLLYVASAGGNVTTYDLHSDGMRIDGPAAGDMLGSNVSSAGDFNNDGVMDVIMSAPGAGEAYLILGGEKEPINLATPGQNVLAITGINPGSNNEIPIFSMGDINGNGGSDIAVVSEGSNAVYLFYDNGNLDGISGTTADASSNADMTIQAAAGFNIVGTAAAGDFNGDGIDDAVVAMRDTSGAGDMISVYVVYGGSGMTIMDNDTGGGNALSDSNNAFQMNYQIPGTSDVNNFDFNISSAGDVNGDGFADLVIGTPNLDTGSGQNGEAIVVYGREANVDIIFDNDTGDSDTTTGLIIANAAGLSLVGSDNSLETLVDGGYTDVSMSAGGGDDTMVVGNDQFRSIDGGGGFDTLRLTDNATDWTLDLSNIGSERVQNMEAIDMGSTGYSQTVVLGVDDIFDMMQNSTGPTLPGIAKITGGADDIFVIEMPDFDGGAGILMDNDWTTSSDGEGGLGKLGASTDATDSSYQSFSLGSGYEFWISDALLDPDGTAATNDGHVVIGSNIVTDGSVDDANVGVNNQIGASGGGQTLVGTNNAAGDTLSDMAGGYKDISMFGMDGDDRLVITSGNFGILNGGIGHDILDDQSAGALDLRSFDARDIGQIEEIEMNNGNDLTLSTQTLTDMAQSAEGGYLLIDGKGTIGHLVIDVAGAGSGSITTTAQLATDMGGDWTYTGAGGQPDANCASGTVETFHSASLNLTVAIDQNLITSNQVETI